MNNIAVLAIKNYVLRIAALSFSFFSNYLVAAAQCPFTETVRTRLVFILVEAERIPVCGLFMNLPAHTAR